MKFNHFVELVKDQNKRLEHVVICFVAKKYPLLFMILVKKLLEHVFGSLTVLDVSTMDIGHLYSSFEMTFLGQTNLFMLSNLHDISQKKRAEFLKYLERYKGPHTIVFWDQQACAQGMVVELPDFINETDFYHYFTPLINTPLKRPFFTHVFARYPKLSLDSCALLIEYSSVISRPVAFMHQWLPALVESQNSLFVLSSYFFAKNEKAFWPYWLSLYPEYSDQFWMVFWADQLFRAYSYLAYTKLARTTDAKKISYNLPFTFMQKDWKQANCQELATAHQQIYTLDWNVKNGLRAHFQLFFLNYFSGYFNSGLKASWTNFELS